MKPGATARILTWGPSAMGIPERPARAGNEGQLIARTITDVFEPGGFQGVEGSRRRSWLAECPLRRQPGRILAHPTYDPVRHGGIAFASRAGQRLALFARRLAARSCKARRSFAAIQNRGTGGGANAGWWSGYGPMQTWSGSSIPARPSTPRSCFRRTVLPRALFSCGRAAVRCRCYYLMGDS